LTRPLGHHGEDVACDGGEVDRLAGVVGAARQGEQFFDDGLASEGLVGDDGEGLCVVVIGGVVVARAALGEFGVAGDDGQGVVDFVCDACGEVADAGQAFGLDEGAALVADLLFEVAVETVELACHAVEVLGESGQFVGAGGRQALVEPACGDATDAGGHALEGSHDAAVLPEADGAGAGEHDKREGSDEPARLVELAAGVVAHGGQGLSHLAGEPGDEREGGVDLACRVAVDRCVGSGVVAALARCEVGVAGGLEAGDGAAQGASDLAEVGGHLGAGAVGQVDAFESVGGGAELIEGDAGLAAAGVEGGAGGEEGPADVGDVAFIHGAPAVVVGHGAVDVGGHADQPPDACPAERGDGEDERGELDGHASVQRHRRRLAASVFIGRPSHRVMRKVGSPGGLCGAATPFRAPRCRVSAPPILSP